MDSLFPFSYDARGWLWIIWAALITGLFNCAFIAAYVVSGVLAFRFATGLF